MRIFFSFVLLACTLSVIAQREIKAVRISDKISIDGEFNETCWNDVPFETDFMQFAPNPGVISPSQTKVKMVYDDYAVYFSVICKDDPTLVSKILSQRDDFNSNIDNFQIVIDTYNDDQNAFIFGVSSMGVQYDSRIAVTGDNPNMNMVWSSAAIQTSEGWQVEFKIPYSAIRFPNKEVQNWGINFYRYVSRNREESTWNPIDPGNNNFVVQSGNVQNLSGIVPPLRLAFMPYISMYADHLKDPDRKDWNAQINGGMDVKFGLNEAFTLDMTLVPDFGQVVFDNKVLNLSPFEIQFNENRQFFTEGTDLFSKSGLFYSRRIGIQAPYTVLTHHLLENEELKDVPASPKLFNASKLSGRTKSGLGIGVFNAITGEQRATAFNYIDSTEREIVVSPMSNYSVVVFDQNFKNNSYVNFTNTNVMRDGSFYDANVSGVSTKFNTKDNKYYFAGSTNVSCKFEDTRVKTGNNWGFETGKQSGNFVATTGYFEESDTYDPNDLGFNTNNNKRIVSATTAYRIFKPFWKLNQLSASLDFTYMRLYKPNVYTGTYLNGFLFMNTRKFHASGIGFNSALTKRHDYFEPRTPGRVFLQPKYLSFNGFISSNYQKRFALDINLFYSFIDVNSWVENGYRISPRLRVTNKIFLVFDHDQSYSFNERGYAVQFGSPVEQSNGIVFGRRDRVNTVNTINLSYTLTKRMGVTFRLRHYRSSIEYDEFYDLNEDGTLTQNSMNGLDLDGNSAYNTNFNAFTIDFVYRWVFLPGSEMNMVWKNSIFSSDLRVNDTYSSNLSTLFDYSPLNSFSVKVIFWLDAQRFMKKR